MAARSGFVLTSVVDDLLAAAERDGLVIRVEVRAGDGITEGTPLATVWGTGGRPLPEVPAQAAADTDASVGGTR